MFAWLSNVHAVARLAFTEALRQRLWLLFLAGAAALVVATPGLSAVDERDKLKLAVVAATGVIGFLAILLAILVAPAALRRDLDARTGFVLFAKPLRRSAYLVGRWVGVVGGLALGIAGLALLAVGAIAWQVDTPHLMLSVREPTAWQQLGALGQVQPIDENRSRIQLTGAPGNGVRWTFTGLPEATGDNGLTLLMRVGLRSLDPFTPVSEILGQASALRPPAADGTAQPPRVLEVTRSSPYGRIRADHTAVEGQVVLRHRDDQRDDLSQDYLSLHLPADCIAPDHSATIQLVRLESRAALTVQRRGSALVAVPGGGFTTNLLRSGLVLLAAAGTLAAWTLLCACVANLAVAVLGGMTLFIAGSALPVMREVAGSDETGLVMRRMLDLASAVLPDLDRFAVSSRLAASQAVDWGQVAAAWGYYGAYTAGFLAVAWFALRRREL